MKSLLALLNESRENFSRKIAQTKGLDEASRVLQGELLSLERTVSGDLTPAQARLLGFSLEALREFAPVLMAASRIEFQSAALDGAPTSREPFLKLTQLALAALLFVSLLSVAAVPAFLSLLLFVFAAREVSLEVGRLETKIPAPFRQLLKLLPWKPPSRGTPHSTPSESQQITVGADALVVVRFLGNALDAVDRGLRDQAPEPQASHDRTPLEQLPELLEFLQELLGTALLKDAESALRTTKQLPQILRGYGLRVEAFEPSDGTGSAHRFIFEPSPNPSNRTYITVTPAVVTADGGRVVRTGRVVEPNVS